MDVYDNALQQLRDTPQTWLITGVAGFIGSNLLEALLTNDQRVVGLDNFATGFEHNLAEVQKNVSKEQWHRFHFIKGDIRSLDDCKAAMTWDEKTPVEHVLHQAALGSVPRSIADPISTNSTNITGFLNMLVAARDSNVQSFTYAASSSTYGDHPDLPKIESRIGRPLSPYAVTKYVNELYADVFAKTYNFLTVGLRYFNVFGPRQNPDGAYAAVIPKWTSSFIKNQPVHINGDGESSRDFCFVKNAIQANILAAFSKPDARNQVYNVAFGQRTTLKDLATMIHEELVRNNCDSISSIEYREFRMGDVRHSLADISKARSLLGYNPAFSIRDGLRSTMPWYLQNLAAQNKISKPLK